MRQQTQQQGYKKAAGRYPPSVRNICSKCNKDVGIRNQINKHKCEVNV